jgi:hypothetical protein
MVFLRTIRGFLEITVLRNFKPEKRYPVGQQAVVIIFHRLLFDHPLKNAIISKEFYGHSVC